MKKTNAARILDRENISYTLISYELDETGLSAVHVAQKTGYNINQIFKTLVLRGETTGIFVCVIPGGNELDLKKTAGVSGNKRVAMIAVKELKALTGYIRGGCSPLGMKKEYPIYIDESCMLHNAICISAGLRGLQISLSPKDLLLVSHATTHNLIKINNC